MTHPALPPGFELVEDDAPPLPPGFQLVDDEGLEIDIIGGTPVSNEQFERDNPTDGMSTQERLAAGFGKSLVDTGRGLRQLATDFSAGIAGPYARPAMQQQADDLRGQYDEARRQDQPLMDTGAGITGNVVGTLTQFVAPGLAGIRTAGSGSALQRLFLPTSVKGSAAQGAVIGGIQPVGEGESRAGQSTLGALLGAGGAAAPKLVGGLYRLLRGQNPAASGVTRKVAETIRREAANPEALMRANPSAIPGAQRTLAEETLDPGVAGLERWARARAPGAFDPLDRANNAARVGAIRQFAGDEQSIAEAAKARSLAANPLRQEAMRETGIDTNRLLSQIKRLETLQTGRPSVQGALARIRGLMTRELSDTEIRRNALAPLQAFTESGRRSAADFDAAKAAMTAIRRGEEPTGQFTSETGRDALAQARKALQTGSVGHDKLSVLYNVRKEINDMLSGKYGGDSAAALAGSRELMAVRGQLDRVLERQAPVFGQYMDAYRQGSAPINRMEVGQSLIGQRSGSAILDPVTGEQVLTPAAFSRQARDLDRVAQQATGFRKAKAGDILQPDDMTTIRGVQDDLERRAFVATSPAANSQTFERLAMDERVAGGLAARIPLVGQAVGYLREIGQARLERTLVEVLANPEQARAILARVPAADRRAIETAISRAGGSLGAMTPALAE